LVVPVQATTSEEGLNAESKVTPVQKVIQLLQGMLEKGKKMKHEEQVQFAAFKQFCDDTIVEKTNAIKEANDLIGVLNPISRSMQRMQSSLR